MERLSPLLHLLSREFVLVQAWKKTAAHLRYHNWFADTLDIDLTTADLPRFISGLSASIETGAWQPDPLRLIPAPKNQEWRVSGKSGVWEPCVSLRASKTRPLAHASLRDQVLATAIMLCLADRIETRQGDPRSQFSSEENRAKVSSYGNRLFCDFESDPPPGRLVHRWGSSKFYRAYFQDYRTFVARPEFVADRHSAPDDEVVIVQADLKQFYDQVRPGLLRKKIRSFQDPTDDDGFFKLSDSLFNWSWHEDDQAAAATYARESDISGFQSVALPQGLVSSGFFANVILINFDEALRAAFGTEIFAGIVLRDTCRYVDDLRVTVSNFAGLQPGKIGELVTEWLNELLAQHADGLAISPEKTAAAAFRGEEQPLVRQARKMQRIQSAISGGFDAAGGEEVIQAVQGLVRSQSELNALAEGGGVKNFTAIPDVRDDTIGRFAAGRFRKTFRSLRPLLDNRGEPERLAKPSLEAGGLPFRRSRLSQAELDDEARGFALGLINSWVRNPSHVRLLRVAVDLWPTPQVLDQILSLFEPYLSGKSRGAARRVAFYCLSELFRAGATETGIVADTETLPDNIDLDGYRETLAETAQRILRSKSATSYPWYLRQQAMLFLAAFSPSRMLTGRRSVPSILHKYSQMLEFLEGRSEDDDPAIYAVQAVVARRSFLSKTDAVALIGPKLTPARFSEIAGRDLEFAREIYAANRPDLPQGSSLANDLGVASWTQPDGTAILKDLVSAKGNRNILRNEIGVISFGLAFLREIVGPTSIPSVITPSSLQLVYEEKGGFARVTNVSFQPTPVGDSYRSIYSPPSWALTDNSWRFQLGFLLRFILTGRVDFSTAVSVPSWREDEPIYRPTTSHWMQRLYGFYNGHNAFGDDWLPISQFTQDLLYSLLAWPGCRAESKVEGVETPEALLEVLELKLAEAERSIGEATGLLMLRIPAPNPSLTRMDRPLRVCVVQSVTPEDAEIGLADLTLSAPAIRRKHRNHLSTALAAVEKMLELRDTHVDQNNRLDWLILPELSVHPDDVASHLIPFARAYRTIILAGMTYQELFAGEPLVNSALWIIPRMAEGRGLEISVRRQGKANLARLERAFNEPTEMVRGFRPCQWLIGYDWTNNRDLAPLWLSAAICYDATDLKLASDLRDRSDVFAIPALNQDVGTFDQMAQALHYHMYQLVLIANNGAYGGSNAHMPKGSPFKRQVFHTHGQPQATISFLEIHDIAEMKQRRAFGELGKVANRGWKFPPAGS